MENPMWERILVDWVNCLKLSKPIHKIIDLKDGIFFSNLQKVIKKTSEIEFDVLTCLFDILNRHYPSFEIDDKSNVHLSDLPHADIAAITSLLMHYTCIYDRRDVLTSPLCHSLQPITQLGIKTFLEKVQECPKLTSEDLSKVILACLEDKRDANISRPQDWLSVVQSPSNSKQSPLLDVFKTPASKVSRLQEKEREIARLITDVELGQEEKENLEEDLRLQNEKYRKLEKQLKQKNIEISRLKSEVLTLENRTPPHYQDKDFREAQKILRTKIEALEQIIEQCDNENEELRNERDAEKHQVKALESQCKTWLEKFIETDNKFQSLAQNAEEFEMKYKNLQAHCSELESLLDELRPKNQNESFNEESFQSSNINRRSRTFETLQSCEDLAHSVVDLQLKDMQKENESLRLLLEDLKRNCRQVEDDIEKITVDRNNISDIKNKIEKDLKISSQKLQQLSSTNEKLLNEIRAGEERYECLVIEKATLSEEYKTCVDQLNDRQKDNENLRKALDNMEKNLKQLKETTDELTVERDNIFTELKVSTDELEQLSLDNKKLSNEYQDLLNKYECLILEKTLLSEQYDSCVAQLKDNQKENETIRTSMRHMESSLIHSEEIFKNSTLEMNNILKSKNEDLNKISNELKSLESEKNYLYTKLQLLEKENDDINENSNKKIKDLEHRQTKLSDQVDQVSLENENLKTNLNSLELKVGKLELENKELHEDKSKISKELENLSTKFEDLMTEKNELSADLVQTKNENSSFVEQIAGLSKKYQETQLNNEKLTNELEASIVDIKETTHLLQVTNEKVEVLQFQNTQTTEQLNCISNIMKSSCEKLYKIFVSLQIYENANGNEICKRTGEDTDQPIEINKISENFKILFGKIENLPAKLQIALEDLQFYREENQNLKAELDGKNKEIENITCEIDEIQINTEKVNKENHDLSEEIVSLKLDIEKLKTDYEEVSENLTKVVEEKNLISNFLDLNNNELHKVIQEKKKILESLKMSNKDVENISDQKKDIETKNSELVQLIKEQSSELKTASEKNTELFKEIVDLRKKVGDVLIDNENLRKALDNMEKSLKQFQETTDELTVERDNISTELKVSTDELEQLSLDNKKLSNGYQDLMNKYECLIHEKILLSEQYDSCVAQLKDNKKENENMRTSLRHMESSLIHSEEIFKNSTLETNNILKSKNEDLNKISNELKSLESEKNYLYTKLELVVKEKDGINENSDEKIKDLEHSKTKLSDQLDQVSLENEFLKTNLNSLELKVAKLESENNELHEDKSKISKELENLSTKFEDLIKDKGLVNKELSILFSQLENIMTEKNKLSAEVIQTKNDNSSFVEQIAGLSGKYQEIQLDKEKLRNELDASVVEIKETKHLLQVTTEQLNCILNIMKSSSEKLYKIFVNLHMYENANGNEICKRIENGTDQPIEINEICENFKILFEKIEEIPAKLTQRNQIVSKDLQFYHEENQNLKAQLDGKNKEIENITCEINEIQKNTEKVYNENHDLSQEIVSLKLDIENLKTKNEEISENLTKVLEEKNLISNFLDLNNNELQKVIQEKEDILEALEMSNKDVENISEQKIDIEKKNSELIQLIKEQSSEMKMASEKNTELFKEIVDLRKKVEDVSKELDAVTSENSKLLEQLENVSKVKADFSEELDKVSQEKADLSDRLQNLMKKHFESSEYIKDLLVKIEHLTEENTQLLGKITTVSNDLEEKSKNFQLLELSCKQLKKLADEKSEILERVSEENKGIFDIVDRLSQEKIEMSDTINQLSEEKMNTIETINKLTTELKILSEDKLKLSESLEMGHKELQKVKRERNEILESQTAIMKETESTILLAHQSAVEVKQDLLKRIETAEKDKEKQRNQCDAELKKVREAYVNVVTMNSKLELENVNLRKKIEERNSQLNEFAQVKEAYEKLLEENNKLMTEVDTVKYKRARDREELVSLLKKEREDADVRESKRIRDVRNEYEGKVEKMKDKMLKMYREEVNKEIKKVKVGHSETGGLQEIVKELRSELFEAEQKIHLLETERDMLRIKESSSQRNLYASRESLRSLKENGNPRESVRSSITSLRSTDIRSRPNSEQMVRKVKSVSTIQPSHRERGNIMSDRRTQPQFTEIEETVTFSRRTSINGVPTNITPSMEMEDEDDDFNNKFLADMKAGKCIVGMASNDGTGRLSELAWRNSLVPPHLKSCYPAETQFVSPTHFKEDDLKSGNVELDDSLCKLLPGEKPRQKKDFGTTAYKKPGPPTPSKNGGRLSLQGNEVLPLREHNDRSPKKSITPSRIKALFMGRTKENSENQFTPKTNNKRMSIFRKQK